MRLARADAVLEQTVPPRRALVRAWLAGGGGPADAASQLGEALAELRGSSEAIEARSERRLAELGEEGLRAELLASPSEASRAGVADSSDAAPTEQLELWRDLRLAELGEQAFRAELLASLPGGREQVEAGRAALAGRRYATLLADRDGTVLPYFRRYAASVQSAWGALCLTRMARRCSGRALVLTAGPLRGPGVLDMAVAPERDFVYAASKGREWQAPGRDAERTPLAPEQAERMRALAEALEGLLGRPGNRRFRLIGSGLQLKHGQVTIARQDVTGSIPPSDSEAWLDELRRVLASLDAEGRWFQLDDTGFDVEIHLAGSPGEAFDKGDGVRLLDARLPLGLGAGPALVCGDTLSDVPMLEAAAQLAPSVRAAFVVRPADPRGQELREAVQRYDPAAVFLPSPETLLLLFAMLAEPC